MAGAPLTSTYQGAGGSRTFITDDIFNIAPADTPILSSIPTREAERELVTYQADTLTAVTITGTVEGASMAFTSGAARDQVSNYTIIQTKTISVSHTQEAKAKRGNIGGLRSEVQYETTKKMKELGRDMEAAAIRSTSASGTSAVARTLDGLQVRITSNTDTSSAARAYTRTLHNTLMQQVAQAGGDPDILVGKPGVIRAIADFASAVGGGNVYYTEPASSHKLMDFWRTLMDPFGTRRVMLHKYGFSTASATATATASAGVMALSTNQMAKWVLIDVQVTKAAKTGISHDWFAECEWTLQEGEEAAHAQWLNLSN